MWRSIRLTGPAEAAFLARRGPGAATPLADSADTAARSTARVEGLTFERAAPAGRVFARGLAFTCPAGAVALFSVGGSPAVARQFCFSVDAVGWPPAPGLPVYTAYSPRFEFAAGGPYPEAKWRQLVPRIGGWYFAGCTPSDVCAPDAPGQVGFDANAADPAGHAGWYTVTIWSWS